jgi:CxxC motif-containing protein (DUF1111 family)
MERVHNDCSQAGPECRPVPDGSQPDSWQACAAEQGSSNVREAYRNIVIATPGTTNSGGEAFPDEDPMFRAIGGVRE